MQRKAETIHEMLAEMLNRLDRSNVGKPAQGKVKGRHAGKAGVNVQLNQQLN